jgi:hypothetical protein
MTPEEAQRMAAAIPSGLGEVVRALLAMRTQTGHTIAKSLKVRSGESMPCRIYSTRDGTAGIEFTVNPPDVEFVSDWRLLNWIFKKGFRRKIMSIEIREFGRRVVATDTTGKEHILASEALTHA